ncbi:MAG: sulfatase-like hydrolase/transferase [Bacteroidota bacterium]|nr:sulfatase-like hydrolase/transferase [Bacteroidota bacterium]
MCLLRLIFYFSFHHPVNTAGALGKTFLLGFRFDLKMVCILLEAMLVLGFLRTADPFRSSAGRRVEFILLGIASVAFTLFYIVDFAHYSYLSQRLSASALNYLQDAGISMTMVWQTYPVLRLLLAWLLGSLFILWLLKISFIRISRSPDIAVKKTWIWFLSAFLLLGLGVFGKLGQYNLRWSEAYSLGSDYEANLALNPFQSFFSSLKFRKSVYNLSKVKQAYPVLQPYFQFPGDSVLLNYDRFIQHVPSTARPNIVVVICESFSAYKSSMWGNPLNTTPFFKAMAEKGIFFDQCFTPSYGTARGVWAVLTGIPDVGQANSTTTRNPAAVDQHSIVNDFDGYEKFYFLGGSASWANIRGLLTDNIKGLHLYEQQDYKAPKIDVWGISDKNLFLEANQVLNKQSGPFIAIIQTADNHRPYTIPSEDKSAFKKIHVSENSLKQFGFESNEEMNAFRYTDFCYQKFMEAASAEKYFPNTIFIFVGDHGIAGNAGKMFPRAWSDERLDNMHVPLLFYAPALLQPKRIHDFVSQIDLLPTAAGLAKISYHNTSLGRDLLDSAHTPVKSFSFLYDPDQNYFGLLMGDYLYREQMTTHKGTLYSVVSDEPVDQAGKGDSLEKMTTLTHALYETSRYLLLNNKKKKP